MICAACHVRGKDRGGDYQFPVGFLPGEDLGVYYVPHNKDDRETTSRLHPDGCSPSGRRIVGGFVRPPCEICKVTRARWGPRPSTVTKDPEGVLRCHEFEDRYEEHAHHARGCGVLCFDCHKKQPKSLDEPRLRHSHPQYFFQHVDECYDNLRTRVPRVPHGPTDPSGQDG